MFIVVLWAIYDRYKQIWATTTDHFSACLSVVVLFQSLFYTPTHMEKIFSELEHNKRFKLKVKQRTRFVSVVAYVHVLARSWTVGHTNLLSLLTNLVASLFIVFFCLPIRLSLFWYPLLFLDCGTTFFTRLIGLLVKFDLITPKHELRACLWLNFSVKMGASSQE